MKKINKLFLSIILLINIIFIPFVNADSGLDASYDGNSSDGGVVSVISSLASPVLELIQAKPGTEDYNTSHVIISVICIIVFCVFTNIYVFKLNDKKNKWILFGINCIPTIAFALICLLTKMELYVYLFPTLLYSGIFALITKIVLKARLKKNMKKVLNIDTKFNEEEISKDIFNIYNDIQIAWMNFKLDKVKDNLSEKIYNDYSKQLEDLKKDNKKNIMDNIKYVSNKITAINILDNIEEIRCELNITCNDYIIQGEEIVKGKKDKECNYTYELVFERNIKTNKYKMTKKKMKKQR